MLGVDTNVLVCFLVRDEERPFARAQRLLRREAERSEPVFVSQLVLLETEWVLRSRYGLSKAEVLGAFSGSLESAELQIEGEPSVEKALFVWKDSAAEFADCLIGMRHLELGC
jgi:predicted nucleic-acid-binding protein